MRGDVCLFRGESFLTHINVISMKIAYYTDSISEHQVPVALKLVEKYGVGNFRYFYLNDRAAHRKQMMGKDAVKFPWTRKISENRDEFQKWTQKADVLYTIFREPLLFEKRIANGKLTFYMSERWFKPPTGFLRLLHPRYFNMARRIVNCFESGLVFYLPTGLIAAKDMARLYLLLKGNWRSLLGTIELDYERFAGGMIHGYPWMRMWGYFVEAGQQFSLQRNKNKPLRVLWVGRFLKLKRVDTIIKAVKNTSGVEFDIYGTGDQEESLKAMSGSCERISFHSVIPLSEVREQMRQHDVYVMSSNGFDGWGAVVSEAIEEGMTVLGTYECGASATLLPDSNLFHVGDWRRLSTMLSALTMEYTEDSYPQYVSPKGWRADDAANALISMIETYGNT